MNTTATGSRDYAGLPNVQFSFLSGQTIGAISCIHVPIIDVSEVKRISHLYYLPTFPASLYPKLQVKLKLWTMIKVRQLRGKGMS